MRLLARLAKLKTWALLGLRMRVDKLRGKQVVLVDVEGLSLIPYVAPILEALRAKSDALSFYVATHYAGHPALAALGVPPGKQFHTSLSRRLSQVDVFVSPHIHGVGPRQAVRIHVNHNQPVKYEAYQKECFVNFDVHFLTSPLHREQTENTIEKYGLQDAGIRMFEVGYPKSDTLMRGEYDREAVLRGMGLDPALKTVLYAPSWDEGLSLRSFGDAAIENILKVEGVNLIVKLHPVSYTPAGAPNHQFYTGGVDWMRRLARFEGHGTFRHAPMDKIDPLLSASDLMVTDVSSVALEFITLDKPVIYIDCPEFYEQTLKKTYAGFGDTTADFVRNDPKANAGRHVGAVAWNIGDLPALVEGCLANPGELSEKRREFARQLTYNPGNAANVAADTILNILAAREAAR